MCGHLSRYSSFRKQQVVTWITNGRCSCPCFVLETGETTMSCQQKTKCEFIKCFTYIPNLVQQVRKTTWTGKCFEYNQTCYECRGRHHFAQYCARWLVCVDFFIPLENFSVIWRHRHCRRRAANFDLCSELMVVEQWEFFSVPHLKWPGVSVYNDQFRGPVTLTSTAKRCHCQSVELSLHVFTTQICCSWDSNTQPSACGANALTHCATAAVHSDELCC